MIFDEDNPESSEESEEPEEPQESEPQEPAAAPRAPYKRSVSTREKIRQSQLAQTPEQKLRRKLAVQRYHASKLLCRNGLHARVPGRLGSCPECRAAAQARWDQKRRARPQSKTVKVRVGSEIKTAVGPVGARPLWGPSKSHLGATGDDEKEKGKGKTGGPAAQAATLFELDPQFVVAGYREPTPGAVARTDIVRELRLLAIAALDRLGFGPPLRECENWEVVTDKVLFGGGEGVRPGIESQKLISPYRDIVLFGMHGRGD